MKGTGFRREALRYTNYVFIASKRGALENVIRWVLKKLKYIFDFLFWKTVLDDSRSFTILSEPADVTWRCALIAHTKHRFSSIDLAMKWHARVLYLCDEMTRAYVVLNFRACSALTLFTHAWHWKLSARSALKIFRHARHRNLLGTLGIENFRHTRHWQFRGTIGIEYFWARTALTIFRHAWYGLWWWSGLIGHHLSMNRISPFQKKKEPTSRLADVRVIYFKVKSYFSIFQTFRFKDLLDFSQKMRISVCEVKCG